MCSSSKSDRSGEGHRVLLGVELRAEDFILMVWGRTDVGEGTNGRGIYTEFRLEHGD